MEPLYLLPAREQAAAALRKAIFAGELSIGQELTQEEVAQRLGISRMPVREAFQILERDGLLVLTNRRAIVQGITDDDIVDHYEIRALLEGEAAERANSKGKDLKDIFKAQELVEKMVLTKDASGYYKANEMFHKSVWEASGSTRLQNLLNQLWNGIPLHLPELLPEQMDKSIIEHRNIVSAIFTGTPDEARDAMYQHVKRSLEDLVQYRKKQNS